MDKPQQDGAGAEGLDDVVLDSNNNSTESLPGLPEIPNLPATENEEQDISMRSDTADFLEETLEINNALEIEDAIYQLDGNNSNSESEEDEFGLNDVFGQHRSQKRPRLQLDSSSEEESAPTNVNVESESEDETEQGNQAEADVNTGAKLFMKDGRQHVVIPTTGPCYIFLKSNRKKPSTILRHINDLLNVYQVFIIKTFFIFSLSIFSAQ